MNENITKDLANIIYGAWIFAVVLAFFWLNSNLFEYDSQSSAISLTWFQSATKFIGTASLCALIILIPYFIYKKLFEQSFAGLVVGLLFIGASIVLMICVSNAYLKIKDKYETKQLEEGVETTG